MARVWAHSQSTGGELLVMLALADFANDEGECWPYIATLAAKARLTERQVQKLLPRLERSGEIRRVKSNGGRNRPHRFFLTVTENGEQNSLNKIHRKRETVNFETGNGELEFTRIEPSGTINNTALAPKARATKSPNWIGQTKKGEDRSAGSNGAMATFHDLFIAKFDAKPDIVGGRDGKILSDLVKSHGVELVIELLHRFFESPPRWVERDSKFTIPTFKSAFNELLAQSRNGKTQMGVL